MAKDDAGRSWTDVDPHSSQKNYYDTFDQFKFPDGSWVTVRLVGKVYKILLHWIPVTKKKGGGDTSYPVLCRRLVDADAYCPCCDAGVRLQTSYLTNAIIRDIQENKPSNPKKLEVPKGTKFRKSGDKWWSPIRVLRITDGSAQKIKNLSDLNRFTVDGKVQTFSVDHPKFGCDLNVLFDPKQQGSGMYDIQKGERAKLDEEEKGYLFYNINVVYDCIPEVKDLISGIKRAYDDDLWEDKNCDMKVVKKLITGSKSVDDDDEDDDEPKKKKKKHRDDDEDDAPKKKKKSKDDDEDEDSEDDEDSDSDDDDDDDRPKKKKSKKSKDDDEDEDDAPKKKKSKKSKDDDEDEDEDSESEDDDDEDEDDAPKKKKSKKSKDDDEDEDSEDEDSESEDDEDEDDEPKKKKKKSKDDDDDDDDRPKKKSKKSKDEDEDDEEEDSDSDEDEDEDDAPKKKKKKSKDDDEDDEDEKPAKSSKHKCKSYGRYKGDRDCVACKEKKACLEAD